MKKNEGAKLVSSALLGVDMESVVVNEKVYVIKPPTIATLAAAGGYLAEIGEGNSMRDVLMTVIGGAEQAAKALSCFISGDASLYDELKEGSLDEIVEGLEKAIKLISAENFIRLSALTRNVTTLIARPK